MSDYQIDVDLDRRQLKIVHHRHWPVAFGVIGLTGGSLAVVGILTTWPMLNTRDAAITSLLLAGFLVGCTILLTWRYAFEARWDAASDTLKIVWTSLLNRRHSTHVVQNPPKLTIFEETGTEGDWFTPAFTDASGATQQLGFGLGVRSAAAEVVERIRQGLTSLSAAPQ